MATGNWGGGWLEEGWWGPKLGIWDSGQGRGTEHKFCLSVRTPDDGASGNHVQAALAAITHSHHPGLLL